MSEPTKKTRKHVVMKMAQRLATWAGHNWIAKPNLREQRRQESFVEQAEYMLTKIENAAVVPPLWAEEC